MIPLSRTTITLQILFTWSPEYPPDIEDRRPLIEAIEAHGYKFTAYIYKADFRIECFSRGLEAVDRNDHLTGVVVHGSYKDVAKGLVENMRRPSIDPDLERLLGVRP